MKTSLAAVSAALLALSLSSCGGSNDDAEASKAISASIMKSQNASGNEAASQLLSLKKKEADCIGSGLVDKIGTDQLKQYKLLTKDNKAGQDVTQVKMSKGDAESATDVLFGCTDVPAMMKKAMNSSGQVPAQMRSCVDKTLNEQALRGMFTNVFQGNEEQAKKDLITPMMRCAQSGAAN